MKIKSVEILVESEFTFETETIDCGSIKNAKIISNHLNKDFKIRITTSNGFAMYSGINAWYQVFIQFPNHEIVA